MHKFPLLSLTEILQNLNTSLQWENAKKRNVPTEYSRGPYSVSYLSHKIPHEFIRQTVINVYHVPGGTIPTRY